MAAHRPARLRRPETHYDLGQDRPVRTPDQIFLNRELLTTKLVELRAVVRVLAQDQAVAPLLEEGRTGQFIIAWCAQAGFIPEGVNPVDWIRVPRKCCLETDAQIRCAKRLTKKYRKSLPPSNPAQQAPRQKNNSP